MQITDVHKARKPVTFAMLHTFLEQYGGYAAVVSVGLCVALWLARAAYSRTWVFVFLNWNLFLAGIPYLCSVLAMAIHRKWPKRKLVVVFLGIVAVAFFPNAPYIVTDFLHLTWSFPNVPQWYDVGMLAAYAWTGVVLGVYALRLLHRIVDKWFGPVVGWGFTLVVIGLSGIGIYMGRFLRWNSWDLVTQPREVIADIAGRLWTPLENPGTYGVSLMFGAFLFICYIALNFGPREQTR